jgi:predicted transposase/invertase (TIGR01784 family)
MGKRINQKQALKGEWDFQLKGVYVISLLDFRLNVEDVDGERVVSKVCLAEETTHVRFSDKLHFTIIELPKFNKQKHELKTDLDCRLFCLKNLKQLRGIPPEIGSPIFRRLFEAAQLNKLTHKEMERYKKSVIEYEDIACAIDFERNRYEALGEKRGIAIGEALGEQRIILNLIASGLPVEEVARLAKVSVKQVHNI